MKKNFSIVLFLFLLPFFSVIASPLEKGKKTQVINQDFYRSISREAPVRRDLFLSKKINFLMQGRGIIKSVSPLIRYRKKLRIEIHDKDSEKFGLKLQYFLFTSNEGWSKDAIVGEMFEFKGQCMVITPLNIQRNAFIFDIVLEDGAIIVQ